ncbi:MAG: tetratricopeptide repeat protein [Acidobacteria bacterium]|nr:tetratricopeptide repeat protein [Acidobacteriota bacterium]
MKTYFAVLIIIVCLSILYPLQKIIDASHPPEEKVQQFLYVSSPTHIKELSFGFDGALADLYWLRSVQYYGRQLLNENNEVSFSQKVDQKLLFPMLDITTTLDPQYVQAYRFGGLFLPDYDPKLALDLLYKGIKENPNNWRLYQALGTVYWQIKDYKKAGEIFLKAGEIPKSPAWLKIIGGVMYSQGGSRATACQLYATLYQEATDDFTKGQMETQLKRVYALNQVDYLNSLLERYKEATGVCPPSLTLLIKTVQQNQEKGECGEIIQIQVNEKGELISILGDKFNYDPTNCKINMPYRVFDPLK